MKLMWRERDGLIHREDMPNRASLGKCSRALLIFQKDLTSLKSRTWQGEVARVFHVPTVSVQRSRGVQGQRAGREMH